MKKPDDPRHQKRIKLLKELFAYCFLKESKYSKKVKTIVESIPESDKLIQDCAPEWPISQINKVDLSVLRLAIYELKFEKTPKKVVIDEAVELAKEFGAESSSKFVNGVLGTIVNKLSPDKKTKKSTLKKKENQV
jgi:transcription antitermination factor NusB